MFFKTLSTTLLQIFCKFMPNFIAIFKGITGPNDNYQDPQAWIGLRITTIDEYRDEEPIHAQVNSHLKINVLWWMLWYLGISWNWSKNLIENIRSVD